jgi:hypothetical protein
MKEKGRATKKKVIERRKKGDNNFVMDLIGKL